MIIVKCKVVLQGSVEAFYEYEARLNRYLLAVQADSEYNAIVNMSTSADQSGRMCTVIAYAAIKEVDFSEWDDTPVEQPVTIPVKDAPLSIRKNIKHNGR